MEASGAAGSLVPFQRPRFRRDDSPTCRSCPTCSASRRHLGRPTPRRPAPIAIPILDRDFPDPAALLADDGFYYAYATQSRDEGGWINIQVARSADLVAWEHLATRFPVKPDWAARHAGFLGAVRAARWRPLRHVSIRPSPTRTMASRGHSLAIAIADVAGRAVHRHRAAVPHRRGVRSDRPDGPARSRERPRLLYWGSGFQPIKVQELSDDLLSFAPGSEPIDIIWPNPVEGAFPRLVEAAWVIAHDGAYYLFYSGDNCCGPQAEYGVMVARSREPTGPVRNARAGARASRTA